MLLSYMGEEDAFWILVSLMKNKPYEMAGMFSRGMVKSAQCLWQMHNLTKTHLPDVAAHLKKQGIVPTMYATQVRSQYPSCEERWSHTPCYNVFCKQWFITVFTYNFKFELVTRIWDIFLYEGWKVVFRIALAILKTNRKEIQSRKFEYILEYFRLVPSQINVSSFVVTILCEPSVVCQEYEIILTRSPLPPFLLSFFDFFLCLIFHVYTPDQ